MERSHLFLSGLLTSTISHGCGVGAGVGVLVGDAVGDGVGAGVGDAVGAGVGGAGVGAAVMRLHWCWLPVPGRCADVSRQSSTQPQW